MLEEDTPLDLERGTLAVEEGRPPLGVGLEEGNLEETKNIFKTTCNQMELQ